MSELIWNDTLVNKAQFKRTRLCSFKENGEHFNCFEPSDSSHCRCHFTAPSSKTSTIATKEV